MPWAVRLLLLLVVGLASALPFPYLCPQIPPHPPAANARQLRADDISMVMAIGDSMVRFRFCACIAHTLKLLLRLLPLPRKPLTDLARSLSSMLLLAPAVYDI